MNKEAQQQSFSDSLHQLDQKFSDGGQAGESGLKRGQALRDYVLERERLRRGVVGGTPEGDAVDAETRAKTNECDFDDPALLTTEKVLRRLTSGREADGIVLLERAITDRQQAVTDEARRRASMPRKSKTSSQLNKLIKDIVATYPTISEHELKRRLRKEIGHGVIQDINATEITFVEDDSMPVKTSALKDRLSREKKKIRKAR